MNRRIRQVRDAARGRIRELMEKVRGVKRNREAKVKAIKAAYNAHNISDAGVQFIAGWEGFRSTPYNDALGHATIGYGHLLHYGGVTQHDRDRWGSISRREALKLLREDAALAVETVERTVTVRLNRNQFDALVSFTFNVGSGAFTDSTLRRELNQGHYGAVAAQLMRWTNNGLPGLVNRRRAEVLLWRKNV